MNGLFINIKNILHDLKILFFKNSNIIAPIQSIILLIFYHKIDYIKKNNLRNN